MADPTTQRGEMEQMDGIGMPGYMRRPLFPAIRWGAIFAGVAVGISVQLALTLLGIAAGLTSTNVTQGETLGIGPLLWAGLSMLVAAFVGGYVAARMSGLKRKGDGVLHGAVSWAVTTIMFVVLATSVGGTLLSGIFNNMGQMARTAAAVSGPGAAGASGNPGAAGGESALGAMMRGEVGKMDADALQRFQQFIQSGQRELAIRQLESTMGVDAARAAGIVDQALILSGTPQAASPQSRAKVESTVKSAGMAAWVVFGAVALSLALGMAGGTLGVRGSRRVSWSAVPTHRHAS